MNRLLSRILLPLTLWLMASGCNHKEFCLDHSHMQRVKVVFDWRNAPDANPASVSAHFFQPGSPQIRFDFAGRDGGYIRIERGKYMVVGMNSDHTDWANFRGNDDIDTFETYTDDATVLSSFGLRANSLPRARGSEDERMALTPGMLWSDRQNDIDITNEKEEEIVTLYPEEVICYYTVTIRNVENLNYLYGGTIDGTLSGMAEGYNHGWHSATDVPVTMPFAIGATDDVNTLYSEFLTFGECRETARKHFLMVYIVFIDGTTAYYSFDVTDQVSKAPDPRHVDILVEGIKIPKPITNDGGMTPSLDDWGEEENQELDM